MANTLIENSKDLDSQDTGQTATGAASKQEVEKIEIRKFFNVGGSDHEIYDIKAGEEPARVSGWQIHEGSKVEVNSDGLGFYDRINLWISASRFSHKVEPSQGGRKLSFTVTDDIQKIVVEGGKIEFEFQDTQNPQNNRFLKPAFFYRAETEEEKKEREAKEKRDGTSGKAQAGQDGPGAISELLNESIGGAAGAFAKGFTGSATPRSTQTTAGGGSAVPGSSATNIQQGGGPDGGYDEGSSQAIEDQQVVEKEILPENFKQSAELAGEYIDKNPEVIANTAVRTEVLSALGSGNLATLGAEGHAALQRVVTSQAVSSGGGNVQLQQAMKIVGQQATAARAEITSQAQATTSVTAQVTSGATVSGGGVTTGGGRVTLSGDGTVAGGGQAVAAVSQTISGPAGAAGKIEAQISGQDRGGAGGGKVGIEATTSAGVEVSAGLSAGPVSPSRPVAAGKPSAQERQNMDLVGEQIYKNPTVLMPNDKARDEVLTALGRADLSKLSPEAQENLQNAVKMIGQKQTKPSEQVLAAANQLGKKLENPEQADEESGGDTQGQTLLGKGMVDGVGSQAPAGMENMQKTGRDLAQKLGTSPINRGRDAGENPIVGSAQAGLGIGRALGGGIDGAMGNGGPAGAPLEEGAGQGVSSAQPGGGSVPPDSTDGAPAGPAGPQTKPGLPENKEPGENGPKEGEDEDEDRPEDSDNQDADDEQAGVGQAAPGLPAAASAATEEAVKVLNVYINGLLLDGVWLVWVFALPSFGGTVLLGAIVGDLLWYYKNRFIDFAAKRIPPSLLPMLKSDTMQKELENIKDKIKFNLAVKVNIVLMNAIVILAILIIILFFAAAIWTACNSWIAGTALWMAGYGEMCKSIIHSVGSGTTAF